jgi:hypothetical protein
VTEGSGGHPLRRATAVICLALAFVPLAGCGGEAAQAPLTGEAADAEEWLESICAAAVEWRHELDSANEELQRGLQEADTPATVQAELLGFLRASESETAALVRHVDGSEPPPIEKGEAIQRAVRTGFEDAREIFGNAADEVESIPTSDPAAFQDAVRDLVSSADDRLNDWPSPFDTMLEDHGSPELREAFDGAPACQTFARGS